MVLKKRGYRQVSLPIPLIEQIEIYMKEHKAAGFISIPEFVRQAIREKLERAESKK
ncbi:MAG: ribbon-helix-helix domain-containing protein [Candidatus Helarchaeota archaeon]